MTDGKGNKDLVVRPREFAYVLDESKGGTTFVVGPFKMTLEQTDQPVRYQSLTEAKGGPPRLVDCKIGECVMPFVDIPEGCYAVLYNPAKDGLRPRIGGRQDVEAELLMGQRVIQPGPDSFALWPGQNVQVRKGHALRHNEFVICRVYNPEAAEAFREKAIVQVAAGDKKDVGEKKDAPKIYPEEFLMGQEFVIAGTSVSFFIPPTGVEVLVDPINRDHFIREACTLEQLEYCILVGQDGKVRYPLGPQVVFPTAKEVFRTRKQDGKSVRKFKAIELDKQAGLHGKVIVDHEVNGKKYKQGDELFITGETHRLYFPRPEVALIHHGDGEKIYATAVGEGDGRYVLNKNTGHVDLVKGPTMLLPDPRTQVLARRVLSDSQCDLWFPGSGEAKAHNRALRGVAEEDEVVLESAAVRRRSTSRSSHVSGEMALAASTSLYADDGAWAREKAGSHHAGEGLGRPSEYTPPRMISFESSKFDGAVLIDVQSGYAVCIKSRSSKRRIVIGPESTLLEYDETLVPFRLTVGRPKNEGGTTTKSDVYLRVSANRISDEIVAETSDCVQLRIRLNYRVDFDREHSERWFDVENYVKFLCEDMASRIRLAFKRMTLSEVQDRGYETLRNIVLGEAGEGGKRPGHIFEENGARIYNVEIFGIAIEDDTIADENQLVQAEIVSLETQRRLKERVVAAAESVAVLDKQLAATRQGTAVYVLAEEGKVAREKHMQAMADETDVAALAKQEQVTSHFAILAESAAMEERLSQRGKEHGFVHGQHEQKQVLELAHVKEVTAARVLEITAMSPELAACLRNLSEVVTASSTLRELGGAALFSGTSIPEVLSRLTVRNGDARALFDKLIPSQQNVSLSKASSEVTDAQQD